MSPNPKNSLIPTFGVVILILICGGLLWWLWEKMKPTTKPIPPSPETTSPSTNLPSPPSLASFKQVQNVPSEGFKYGGSTTWKPIRDKVDPEIQKAQPNFRLMYTDPDKNVTLPGSGTGIDMLLRNQLDFSQSSRELTHDEQSRGLISKPIAIDGVAIAVNPKLNIFVLTVDQLKNIYTGQITNWNQVGGQDMQIKPYSRSLEAGGTVEYLTDKVLKGESLGPNVDFAKNTTDGLDKVKQNPGGIYYATASEVVIDCGIKPLEIRNQDGIAVSPYDPPLRCNNDSKYANKPNIQAFHNGSYPLTRMLYVIINTKDETQQKAGEAYANLLLTTQGQQLIEDAGFSGISK